MYPTRDNTYWILIFIFKKTQTVNVIHIHLAYSLTTTSCFQGKEKKYLKKIIAFQWNGRNKTLWDRRDKENQVFQYEVGHRNLTALLQTTTWTITKQWAGGELRACSQLRGTQGGVSSHCLFSQIFLQNYLQCTKFPTPPAGEIIHEGTKHSYE